MPTRDELEQDLLIVEAERDSAQKELYEARKEIERLKGANALVIQKASAEGVEIDVSDQEISERRELEVLREGVDRDLEALNELVAPSSPSGRVESALDVVRANQRERAELQERTVRANNLLSRLAQLLKLDRWDDQDGDTLLTRLQMVVGHRAKLELALKRWKQDLAQIPDLEGPGVDAIEIGRKRAFAMGAVTALEQALALPVERAAVDPRGLRRIKYIVSGNEVVYHTPPDALARDVRKTVIEVLYPMGLQPPMPVDLWLMYDENGTPLPLDKPFKEIALPTDRVIVTTPVGAGA